MARFPLKKTSLILFLSLSLLTSLVSCEKKDENNQPKAKESQSKRALTATSYKYGYDGQFGLFDMADTAEAYNENTLVGKAKAIELQDSPVGGPRMLKIEVTHFSVDGDPVYKGYVYIQAGFSGGRLLREEDISGKREFTVFGSWPFGH